ncbi:MAG TPA: hypothetical protein VF677_09605 [Flavobacterium sp.]|jgi:hypothetical protein
MAGGIITRTTLGTHSTDLEGGFTGYYDQTNLNAGGQNRFQAKQTNINIPKSPPPVGKYFKRGWWSDKNDKPIKNALIGKTVKFHIEMDRAKVPAGSKINFTLKDWDGIWDEDDSIRLYSATKDPKTNTYPKINEFITDANGKTSLYVTLTERLIQLIQDDGGNEIELYFECSYYDVSDKETEALDLPAEEFNYLIVYEKEVLITVLIELPHSSYSMFKKGEFFSALGLAGHSAMAIGDRYFDYGPDYDLNNNGTPGWDSRGNRLPVEIIPTSEKDYDIDFNGDGDKNDIVYLNENNLNEKNAPGRPWWGEIVAQDLRINVNDVKLSQVLSFILKHWHYNNVYGEVNKIEFYAKKSEANRMIKWWEERYKHLKIYSVYPETGEQCTTTVKTAIQEGYPLIYGKVINRLSDVTQRPVGLLQELRKFVSSSKQHFNEPASVNIIKPESTDYP